MNAPLRRVGVVVLVLFALLFANLNYVQAVKGDEYRTNQYNKRVQIEEYERQRGNIIVDGEAIARSAGTSGTLKFARSYPNKQTYAHIVGYKPVNLQATNIERWENDFLAGTSGEFLGDRFVEMFTGKRSPGGNLVLSIRKQVQETALTQLSRNRVESDRGAVVALDPATGAVLSMVSIPTYDPNPMTAHNTTAAGDAYKKLDKDPKKPLLNRATQERYPPGSTFKVLVAATAIESGVRPDQVVEGGASFVPDDTTNPINNAPGVNCPSSITLDKALEVSCNTAFSRLCAGKGDQSGLGADKIKEMAKRFGFEEAPVFAGDDKNIMRTAASITGPIADDPSLAQSCIGQRDVVMTPLQGAMVAAAVANHGVQMQPYLIESRQGPDLKQLDKTEPTKLREPLTADVADQVREMMLHVVRDGTGTDAQIDGFDVGGKTGTAENGGADHGWFIGFALKDGQPVVAVAVFLQNAGAGGSREATRIGGEVMRAAIKAKGLQ